MPGFSERISRCIGATFYLFIMGLAACGDPASVVRPVAANAVTVTNGNAGDAYYYFDGKPVPLALDPTRLVVTAALPTGAMVNEAATDLLAASGTDVASTRRMGPPPYHWLLKLSGSTSRAAAADARQRLRRDPRFHFVGRVYKTVEGAHDVILLDHVVARFRNGVDAATVRALAASLGSSVIRLPVPDSGYRTYVLSVPEDSASDPLQLANTLEEDPRVVWASPDFVSDWNLNSVPSDPYYASQYYLKSTTTFQGLPADIDAEPAWSYTTGDPSLRITFIGSGIDSNHPEFASRTMAGFDALWYDAAPGEWAGHPYAGDSHGTAVAGIAVALHDGRGIAGIAPGVQYDAVRIVRQAESATPQWATANDIANGITWAYQRSDVINNSWGGGAYNQTILSAFLDALTYGRNGKGTSLVFSVGNDSTTQQWQSSINGSIAVAALTASGRRASYSNYGSAITVSAFGGAYSGLPCYGGDVYTTDLSYTHPCSDDPSGLGGYTSTFSGTSAAAPQVSGAIALILSREPNLTAAQVKQRIISTSDDLWHDATHYGSGKLDIARAVLNFTLTMSGPSGPPSAGYYTYTATPAGATGSYTYQWFISYDDATFFDLNDSAQQHTEYVGTDSHFWLRVIATSAGVRAVSTKEIIGACVTTASSTTVTPTVIIPPGC